VLIGFRNLCPQFATGLYAAVAQRKGDNLARTSAHIAVRSQRLFFRFNTNDQTSSHSS
jgi:hypothetical protein